MSEPVRAFDGPLPETTVRPGPVAGAEPSYVPAALLEMDLPAGPRRFWCSPCALRHDAQDAAFKAVGSSERSTAPIREVRASGDVCEQCAFEARSARGEMGR